MLRWRWLWFLPLQDAKHFREPRDALAQFLFFRHIKIATIKNVPVMARASAIR